MDAIAVEDGRSNENLFFSQPRLLFKWGTGARVLRDSGTREVECRHCTRTLGTRTLGHMGGALTDIKSGIAERCN